MVCDGCKLNIVPTDMSHMNAANLDYLLIDLSYHQSARMFFVLDRCTIFN